MPDATCLGPPKTCGPAPALLAAAPSQGLWTSPCPSVPVSGGLRTWQGPVPAGGAWAARGAGGDLGTCPPLHQAQGFLVPLQAGHAAAWGRAVRGAPGGAAPSPLPPVSSTARDRGAFLTPPCSAMSPAECQPHSSSSNAPISWGCGDTVRALLCPRCPLGAVLLPCPCAAGMRRLLPAVLWLPPPSSSLPGGRAALPVPPRTPRIAFLLGCQQFLGLPPARGRAASGSSGHSHRRSPSAACGRSRAFHFAHALSLDCNLPMHLYVHSCTHRRVCKYKCTGGAATGRGCTSGFAPSRVLFSPSTLLVVALPKPGVGCFYCSLYS